MTPEAFGLIFWCWWRWCPAPLRFPFSYILECDPYIRLGLLPCCRSSHELNSIQRPFYNQGKSVGFYKYTIKVFVSFSVVVLCSQRQVGMCPDISKVPDKTHEERLRALERSVSAQKAKQGSKTETMELLVEGLKFKNILLLEELFLSVPGESMIVYKSNQRKLRDQTCCVERAEGRDG